MKSNKVANGSKAEKGSLLDYEDSHPYTKRNTIEPNSEEEKLMGNIINDSKNDKRKGVPNTSTSKTVFKK